MKLECPPQWVTLYDDVGQAQATTPHRRGCRARVRGLEETPRSTRAPGIPRHDAHWDRSGRCLGSRANAANAARRRATRRAQPEGSLPRPQRSRWHREWLHLRETGRHTRVEKWTPKKFDETSHDVFQAGFPFCRCTRVTDGKINVSLHLKELSTRNIKTRAGKPLGRVQWTTFFCPSGT